MSTEIRELIESATTKVDTFQENIQELKDLLSIELEKDYMESNGYEIEMFKTDNSKPAAVEFQLNTPTF